MNQTLVKVGIIVVIALAGLGFVIFNNLNSTPNTSTPNQVEDVNTNEATTKEEAKEVYTKAIVAEHKDSKSCWSIVNNKVYDLTEWINKHPGGAERILMICGKDGSELFNKQHEGQGRPEGMLSTFYLGDLTME